MIPTQPSAQASDEPMRAAARSFVILANQCGIDTDTDGDIWGSTNGALLVFARAVRDAALNEATALFPKPHMEYFGSDIQESITALKAQPAPTEAQGDAVIAASVAHVTIADAKFAIKQMQNFVNTDNFICLMLDDNIDTLRKFVHGRSEAAIAERAVQGEDSARLEWKRITGPGQVKVGDKLRFTIGDVLFNERVKQIINPGYPDEELIYNKRRNFYVITSNAITNFGSSKNVEYLARASAETGGVKS